MDIPADLMPGPYLWISAISLILLLLLAILTAPWSKIRDGEAQHVYLGAIVSISLLWVMRGGIQPGLNFHLLGMTVVCLMFEWQFALFAASIVVALTTWRGDAGWEAYALNVLLMGALPILFTRAILYLCQRKLPHNYFIYVFINAFFVGGISILLVGSLSSWIQYAAAVHPAGSIFDNFLVVLPLMMFGEGFLNGGAMTLLVAYRPHWVATFHDHWYLKN
jgi:uncharacterized membrane protein